MREAGLPRAGPRDHLAVAGVLVLTLLGLLPALLWVPVAPVLRPWLRGRLRRRLARAPGRPDPAPPIDADAWVGREVALLAGEASGDRLVAPVVAAMQARCPTLRVTGFAGPRAAAAGAALDGDITDRAVVGVVAVVRSIGFWWRFLAGWHARLRLAPPDLLLTVDFPGLNARVARWARRRGVPAVHLVAPAVWAYLPWRAWRWARATDAVLAVWPFEAELLGALGMRCRVVGHPLLERPLRPLCTAPEPPEGPARVDLLPGSRAQEVERHAALFLEAAASLEAERPRTRFVVRLAAGRHREIVTRALAAARRRPRDVVVRVGDEEEEAGDDAHLPLLGALACSGTVTAEMAVGGVPMAVVYRVSAAARLGALLGLTAPYIALANLLTGTRTVPERLLVRRRSDLVAADLGRALAPEAWRAARRAFVALRERAAVDGVAARTAAVVLDRAPGAHGDGAGC